MVEISKKYLQDLSGDLHKMEGKLGPIPEGKFLGHAARKIEAGWERLVRVFKEHKWISRQQHELTRLENKISSVKNDYEALSSKIEKAAHEGKLQDFLDLNEALVKQLDTMLRVCDFIGSKVQKGKVREEDVKKVKDQIESLKSKCESEGKEVSAMMKSEKPGKKEATEGEESKIEGEESSDIEGEESESEEVKKKEESPYQKISDFKKDIESEDKAELEEKWRGEDFVKLEEEEEELPENKSPPMTPKSSEGTPTSVKETDLSKVASKLKEYKDKEEAKTKEPSDTPEEFHDLSEGLKEAFKTSETSTPKKTPTPTKTESPKKGMQKKPIDLSAATERLEQAKAKEKAQLSDVAKQEKAYEMLKQAVTNIYKEIEEDKSLDRVNLQNLLNDHPDLTPDDYAEVSKNTLKFAYAQADREVPKEFIERIDRALNL